MNKRLFFGLICGLVCGELVFGTGSTEISYATTNLGSNQWQFTYQVTNLALSAPINEFTIWFDYGSYQNLAITTLDPPAGNWDEMVWQPELGLGNGGYDAMAISLGIGPGEMETGFSVRFDWLGTGTPGSQFYEILNPSDFSRIDSGMTIPIPEPNTLMVILAGFGLIKKTKR